MNKTLLFLLLPGLLISCKPTPPSGDNGEIVPLTSECLLKNSDLYMKYPYKIKVQDSIMCIWDLHGGDRFYHLYSYPELQFITSFAVNGRGPEEYISTGGFCMDEQHIYVFDTSRARLSIFRKDSLMQQRISPARIIDYPQAGIPILNFCRTDQGFALLNFDGPERIAFIDTCGHLLNKKYEIPWGNTAKNKAYPTMTASLWNSYLDYNPDNHLLVLVTQNGELLEIHNLASDSSRFIVGKGGEPDFLSDKNGLLVGKIKGYQDVQVGKKAIYTLFSGTDHQEELKKMMKGQPTPDGGNLFLVYDLDGKLIRKFLLDHYTNGITMSISCLTFKSAHLNWGMELPQIMSKVSVISAILINLTRIIFNFSCSRAVRISLLLSIRSSTAFNKIAIGFFSSCSR